MRRSKAATNRASPRNTTTTMRTWLATTGLLLAGAVTLGGQAADPLHTIGRGDLYLVVPDGEDRLIVEDFEPSVPTAVRTAPPTYPPGVQGKQAIGLAAIIGIDGTVEEATVVRSVAYIGQSPEQGQVPSDPLLDAAAVAAVERWAYRPVLLDGKPIRLRIMVSVHFRPDPVRQ